VTLFEDDFEVDRGWTLADGWERGVPLGLGGQELQYPVPDPTAGCNGASVLGYNLAGDYDNDLPERYATSPPIDCSESGYVLLRFSRWLGVEQPVYDNACIQVSNDGATWVKAWTNPAVIVDLEWAEIEYDISAIAGGEQTVYVRFVMGPTDVALRYCGWNVDNLRVVAQKCRAAGCVGDRGNVLLEPVCDPTDQTVDVGDVTNLIRHLFVSLEPLCNIDEADLDYSGIIRA
jgi:hypothetical protein